MAAHLIPGDRARCDVPAGTARAPQPGGGRAVTRTGATAGIVGFVALALYLGDETLRAPLTGALLVLAGLSVVAVGLALRFPIALLTTVAMVTAGALVSTLVLAADPEAPRGPTELCDPSCGISAAGLVVIVMIPALGLVLLGAAIRALVARQGPSRTT